jgi:hypothetical protein
MADAYNLSTDVPEATAPPKPKPATATSSRVDNIRAQLQQEIANAETAREQVLREIEEAELRRETLEKEAAQSLTEAAGRRQKLESFEAQQTAAAAAAAAGGGGLLGAAAPIAIGSLGAIAFGRAALESRQTKIEEQQRIEAEQAAQAEVASASKGNLLGVSSQIYRCSLHILFLSGLLRWQTHSFCHIFFGKTTATSWWCRRDYCRCGCLERCWKRRCCKCSNQPQHPTGGTLAKSRK